MKFAPAALGMMLSLTGCKNGDAEFSDSENGTTAYFSYQYPVRTIILGDDESDTSLDKQHKCQIKATFGGSRKGSNGTLTVQVDPTLADDLTFADGSPVKAMPDSYYTLSTNKLAFNGTYQGATTVQLTDDFFNDPDAVRNTYVIPLVITESTGFTRVASGTPKSGFTNPKRTDDKAWQVYPQDYVLYCVKFQNKYSGWWITNHTPSTDNIEKASQVEITTRSLHSSVYRVTYQNGTTVNTADLLLTFDDNENCTVSSLTTGVTATGSGKYTDNGEKNSWNEKDRDAIDLKYTVTFADGYSKTVDERLVWWRSGVKSEVFSPIYTK